MLREALVKRAATIASAKIEMRNVYVRIWEESVVLNFMHKRVSRVPSYRNEYALIRRVKRVENFRVRNSREARMVEFFYSF